MAKDNSLLIKINGSAKDFIDEIDKVKKRTETLEKSLTKVAKVSAIAFAGFAATIALVTKSFATYETALVGVGKTTNMEGQKLEKFGKKFQKLSSDIPVATNELLGIAQAAGQLGVTGEANLLKFTETMAKLGVATTLTGEEGATSIARILSVTREGIGVVDRFGSVLVELGNTVEANESQIVAVTTEVAKSTAQFNIGATAAAALGATLAALGQQAQLGGSVLGRTFRHMQATIRKGGKQLEVFTQLTGLSGEQLKKTFKEDATKVLELFLNGLNDVKDTTLGVSGVLELFGLKGDEINKVLPVLAINVDKVTANLKKSKKAFEENTALNEEAEKAFATLASTAQRTSNNFTNITTNIGKSLAPALTELLESLNDVLKSLSEMDQETFDMIATFLKWGAIVTGSIATIATLGLGFLKLRSIMVGLRIAFGVGRIAAIGFMGAMTGGLSIILGFLPEIISGVKMLINYLGQEKKPKALETINKELKETIKLRDELAKDPDITISGKAKLVSLDAEIKKLKEVRQARLKASESFGTGELLIRPKADTGLMPDFGFGEQKIPFRPEEAEDDSTEKIKRNLNIKQTLIDEATQKRINAARLENAQLIALQKERISGATEEELEGLQRKQEIESEFANARQIKNEEERNLALQNLTLKHEDELAAIEEYELLKQERALERLEEKQALDAELRELDVAQRDLFNEEDRAALSNQLDTQKQAEKKYAKNKLNRQIAERNKYKQDELKYGTGIAEMKNFFNSEEVQGFKNTAGQLAALSKSKNSKMKAIGKAAASVNAGIATAEGAIKAYTSLAGIPIVGPALGVAAAGALIAFGIEQQGKIMGFAKGGLAKGGTVGVDSIPAMVQNNELMAPPKSFDEVVEGTARERGFTKNDEDDESTDGIDVNISMNENLIDFIEVQVNERRAEGVSTI